MKKWRPESWSVQARQMSEEMIISINKGMCSIAEATNYFSTSYRYPMIRQRAAKHFGRAVRTGKVHENLQVATAYKEYIEFLKERRTKHGTY